MTLRTLNYGNYGIFLSMGNAGFCPSTVGFGVWNQNPDHCDEDCLDPKGLRVHVPNQGSFQDYFKGSVKGSIGFMGPGFKGPCTQLVYTLALNQGRCIYYLGTWTLRVSPQKPAATKRVESLSLEALTIYGPASGPGPPRVAAGWLGGAGAGKGRTQALCKP